MLDTADISQTLDTDMPESPAAISADATQAINDLSERIQRLIEPLNAPVFLKQIFCQTLDWQYINQPMPMTLLPESARGGLAEAHIIAQCEDIRLCYLRADSSEISASDQHPMLQRLSRAWPQVVVAFANFGQDQLDLAIRDLSGALHRISLDRSLFGPGELAQALYALRAFDITGDEPPVQMEVVERLERQFKRLPQRLRERHGLRSSPLEREVQRHRLLDRREEGNLRSQFNAGERHPDRDKLVLANLRLAISIAYRFRGRGLDWEDLLQVGVLGLMRAADKFDPSLGYKFSTYATWWVRQHMGRAVDESAHLIDLPAYCGRLVRRYRSLVRDHLLYFGCRPTDAEVQDYFELDHDQWIVLRQTIAAATTPRMLDTVADCTGEWVRPAYGHFRERTFNEDRLVMQNDRASAVELTIQKCLDPAQWGNYSSQVWARGRYA